MTITGRQQEPERGCAFPPHPGGDGGGPQMVTDSAASRFADWIRHAPGERLPLPAIPAVWTAAEILHLAGVPGLYPGAAAVAAAGLSYGLGEKHAQAADEERPRLRGAELAAVTGAVGAWLTVGTIWGPLAGPDHALSIAYAAGAAGGYWWLRRHDALRAARARRDAKAAWLARKAAWHALAPRLGLQGSHLLSEDATLLGETRLIDTRGTGRRASQLASADLAERIGEIEMIPAGRIDVTTDRIPGRLRISIRRTDPWASPIPHPATVPDSPYARYVPYPATIREPVTIGIDPETGKPLQLALWTAKGAKVVMIAGKKDAGKTVLMNDLSERITACPDARLLQVNLAKVLEDDCWKPLAAASALGQAGKARRILQFAADVIFTRSRSGRRTPVHQPTPAEPLYVLKIDEVDEVAKLPDCKALLKFISSKCRSEGVALIIAGQRATAQWIGGADMRANVDTAVWGKFGRAGEARHVAGSEIDLPDMGAYGEGASGVFGVTELGGSGSYVKGRTFCLREIDDLERIVRERLADQARHVLEPALAGLAAAWAKITGTGPPGDGEDDGDAEGRTAGGARAEDDEDDEDDEDAAAPAAAAGHDYDATALTAKVAAARAAAAETAAIPPVPPGMEDHAAAVLAERQRQFMAAYTDVALPEADQAALRAMLAGPGGITTRAAAASLPWSHTRVHQQLVRWRQEGTAEKRGNGSAQRWHAAAPGTPAAPYPPLRAVPDDAAGDGTP
jgi:hypothetical protein